ncbi:transcription factor IIA alpha-beta subunit [Trypanosoma conorhini]|uniref:Transcription factor IIA alpha-beta subunit n=1 Tax=Trypanosoma conorhini TaxID=83891 RepID=A0A3R7L647_9TRYP|nr:transcription factor IIA alpha-beta subunit [Trypanosoma conorhini]RNF21789.1 transcription factor IIA alpha-beta subunit [Trypanosoma conorhini]
MSKKKCRKGRKKRSCSTSDVYECAMRNFRQLLLERMSHHEDEVFSARARFQMQRTHDKEHFDRLQHKRKHSERVRGTAGRRSVRGAAAAAEDIEEPSAAEQEFLADQQKLYVEHEEELQRSYPLAFLDDESAGAVTFTLMPTLRGKFEALARERTRLYKECPESMEPKRLSSVPNLAVQPQHGGVTEYAADKSQPVLVKEEYDVGASATLEVGRGAYIIPQTANKQAYKVGGAEENREASPPQEENSEDGSESCGSLDADRGVVKPPWLSTITSGGEVEFVRMALLSQEQSRQARCEEKQRWLEGLLTPSTPRDMQRRAKEELRRLEKERKKDAVRAAELWCLWRAARDKVNSSSGMVNSTGNREAVVAGGNQDDSEGIKRQSARALPAEEVEGGEGVDDGGQGEYYTPTGFSSERWLKRMQFARKLEDQDNTNSGKAVTSAGDHSVSTSPSASSSFCMSWETIVLEDVATTNGSDDSISNRLEVKAQSYLWPQHIEASIPHVLCGEAVRGTGWWRSFVPDVQGTVTRGGENAEAEDGACDDDETSGRRTEGETNMPSVVKFPRWARKVWLKLDSLGDFVAERVRFYQGRLHT